MNSTTVLQNCGAANHGRGRLSGGPVARFLGDTREYPWSSATSCLKDGCGHDWPPRNFATQHATFL